MGDSTNYCGKGLSNIEHNYVYVIYEDKNNNSDNNLIKEIETLKIEVENLKKDLESFKEFQKNLTKEVERIDSLNSRY